MLRSFGTLPAQRPGEFKTIEAVINFYFLKLSGCDQGPYSDEQIAEMFAVARVDRATPCKADLLSEWKTIDDYFPMLKYGTQLPPRTLPQQSAQAKQTFSGNSVAITNVDVPFGSILKMFFKTFAAWLIVIACFTPVIFIIWSIVFAIIAALIGHSLSMPHRP